MNDAKNNPTKPPIKPSKSDSARNASKILCLRKPSALNVPISAVRLATAEYMVIIAPIIAPMEKIMVSDIPRIRRNFAIISD